MVGGIPACSIYQFLWCKSSHHGWFQSTILTSLAAEIGRNACHQFSSAGKHGLQQPPSESSLEREHGQKQRGCGNVFISCHRGQSLFLVPYWLWDIGTHLLLPRICSHEKQCGKSGNIPAKPQLFPPNLEKFPSFSLFWLAKNSNCRHVREKIPHFRA